MAYTYLNDNQGMPYPFYGHGSLPFPMSIITGLSLCIRANSTTNMPVYATSVVITENSVRLAICRKTEDEAVSELLGMFYANTDGYYTYIPTTAGLNPVYEDETIEPQALRYVYADFAPIQREDTDGITTQYTTELDSIIENMQVFYSYVRANIKTIPGRATSYGHIQLGSIPASAVGAYIGEFYIDPSCITYMPDDVCGYHMAYTVNNVTRPITQAFAVTCAGLLTLTVDGNVVAVGTSYDADTVTLVKNNYATRDTVRLINGMKAEATATNPKPTLTLKNLPNAHWEIVRKTPAALVVSINSTTAYPNCYDYTSIEDDMVEETDNASTL